MAVNGCKKGVEFETLGPGKDYRDRRLPACTRYSKAPFNLRFRFESSTDHNSLESPALCAGWKPAVPVSLPNFR